MNKSPVVFGSFREVQIVNGQVVKDVELVEQMGPKKEVIKGSVNGKPVFISRNLRRTRKKSSTKKRSNKRSSKKPTPKK